jgi:predicted Zn-dependent peptidase
MNRKEAPELNQVEHISLVAPQIIREFPVPFYFMKEIPNATSRIELYFNAGTINGKIGLASAVSGLLLSGTNVKNSTQIHTELDNLGAYTDISIGHESVIVTLYGLNEKLSEITSLFLDSILNADFKQKEIDELIADRKQKLKINFEKVSFLAQREFTKNLFFESNYGRVIEEKDYDAISREEICDFHKNQYLNGLNKVVLVGEFSESEVVKIQDMLAPLCAITLPSFTDSLTNNSGRFSVSKEGALQSSIRIGRILFTRKHADYIPFAILNTVLGDYFGSRLMSNLREDKGYTYGVNSMVSEYQNSGYFLIATDVAAEHRESALNEIRIELEKLQKELIQEHELELVKNYLLGHLLKSADGPYAMTDLYVHLQNYGFDEAYYNRYIQEINEISAEKLQECARKYLNWDDLTIVTAG